LTHRAEPDPAVNRSTVNLFDPELWATAADEIGGVRVLHLHHGEAGDDVVLCRIEPGAEYAHQRARPTNVLVIDGEVTIGSGAGSTAAPAGTYTPLGGRTITGADRGPALVLVLSGPALGIETKSLADPDGWLGVAPGIQFLPLGEATTAPELAERVVAAVRLAPGGHAPRHEHATVHRFVFLEGEVDDCVIHPDGTRELTRRYRGDLVAYPFPVEHELSSPTGCEIFFVHEPVLYSR
jgi:hypothetical protein